MPTLAVFPLAVGRYFRRLMKTWNISIVREEDEGYGSVGHEIVPLPILETLTDNFLASLRLL